MELNRRGFGVHLIIHPVIRVRRDERRAACSRCCRRRRRRPRARSPSRSIHVEVDRQTDPRRARASSQRPPRARDRRGARRRRGLAADARARAASIAARARASDPPPASTATRSPRPSAFLALARGPPLHLPRLPRVRPVPEDGDGTARRRVPGSGLGILRDERASATLARASTQLPPAVRERALEPYLLNLTKANSRATVHRPAYLDYVGVKRFDARRRGDRRAALPRPLHATAYHASPREIPILRRKVDAVLARAALPARQPQREGADRDPRDATRATSCSRSPVDELFEIAMGILHLGERQRVRLFVRRDTFGRFLSCLVFVPRDRFNTENRRRIEAILRRALRRARASTTRRASRSRCSCACTTSIYVEPGATCRDYDAARDRDAARGRHALVGRRPRGRRWSRSYGEERGGALLPPLRRRVPGRLPRRLGARAPRSPTSSASRSSPRTTTSSLQPLPPARGAAPARCARSCSASGAPLALSDMLPLFENMGVQVADERPYEIIPRGREPRLDLRLRPDLLGRRRARGRRASATRFQDAFVRAWRGDVENDGYNRLRAARRG